MSCKLEKLKAKAFANPKLKQEYDRLEPEFKLINDLIKKRNTTGLTQHQVAEQIDTEEVKTSIQKK
ncbi:hypothetical protein [Vibrio hibernica]|mgnify:CR=1 FL=1|uniref:hypothetical protein n=1 Tax=Vibrio hibernica TaxID=2587465 RepID=UPI00187FC511|nr:hypothetical protein [Vibrio hibernica]